MLSKERFVKIMSILQTANDFVDETNTKIRALREQLENDFIDANSLGIFHDSIVVELLEKIFNDKDIISWWIYELDFGRRYTAGCFTESDGTEIDISTSEKLYDYLIENMKR